MYARVGISQFRPGNLDEATSIYNDSVVPAAKQQPGFKGGLSLADPTTGKGMSITLWETEADMKAGETSGYLQEQIAKLAGLMAAPPVVEHYEVTLQV